MHTASPWNFYSSLFHSPWQALKASHSHQWSSRCWQTPVWSCRQSTTSPSLSIRKVRPLGFAFTWCSCSETLPLPDFVLSPRIALTVPFCCRLQASSSILYSAVKRSLHAAVVQGIGVFGGVLTWDSFELCLRILWNSTSWPKLCQGPS